MNYLPGRVSKSAAWGMLARVYMFRAGEPKRDKEVGLANSTTSAEITEYFKKASYYAQLVKNEGHSLTAKYWDFFIDICSDKYNTALNKDGAKANESIWEVEFAGNRSTDVRAEGRIGNIIGIQGKDLSSYIQTSKSSFGRGGMLTKTNIARKVADEGITVIIANGKRDNILVDLIQHPESTLCTRFTPSPEPVSSVKKWIAHSEGFAKGELHINYCATELLFSDKAVSILPVGIIDVIGEFEKDDIVRIVDFGGKPIGVGKANCDSTQAREAMGKHGKKPVVHYDYLYIE